MIRPSPAHFLLLFLAACAGSPEQSEPKKDPALEQAFQESQARSKDALARQKAFEQVLLDVDKMLDKYVQAVWQSGNERADALADTLQKTLRQIATDRFDELMRTASNPDLVGNRAIALGALGFSGHKEALDPLLTALRDPEPVIVHNAVFALGQLEDSRTPPGLLGDLIQKKSLPIDVRRGASWALMRVQPMLFDPESATPTWIAILEGRSSETDEGILIHAVRSVGLMRKRDYAKTVIPLLSHPTPKVRETAAVAAGRLQDPSAVEPLLALIGPAETNMNVKLAARKALKALAGGTDVGYDLAEWRKVFQRG